jgi:hypothetical protein
MAPFSNIGQPGRNDPCFCGSGKKYKKCHGNPAPQSKAPVHLPDPALLAERALAQEKQREKQQGLGRPIISSATGGKRFVAVGGKVLASAKWRTFHDFLFDYLREVFGRNWLIAEAEKPEESRNPLVINFERAVNARKRSGDKSNGVVPRAATGTEAFLLDLAYSLYLLEHNAKIQATLLQRMRQRDQFDGAFYETLVAGILIRAGYSIEFENECDSTGTHCEFTATCRATGRNFSVEAKRRMEGKPHLDVGSQLHGALRKRAAYERLVFIEMNVADSMIGEGADALIARVVKVLDSRENLKYQGNPLPPAYLIVTNNPYSYHPDTPINRWFGAHGYKIPDLKVGTQFSNLREMINSREKHREILELMESIRDHSSIPSTFEGEIPEFAFGGATSRLIIGDKYAVADDTGKEVTGILRHASVIEQQKSAYCVFELPDSKNIVYSIELTDAELGACKRPSRYVLWPIRHAAKSPDEGFTGALRLVLQKVRKYIEGAAADEFERCHRY